jgi:hypothetical protein
MRDPKGNGSTPSAAPPPVPPGGPGDGPPSHSKTPPPDPLRIDLSRYSETTRRAVWDVLAAHQFGASAEEAREAAAAADWVETHSAEEAGLVVHYWLGRWIAAWRVLDEPDEGPDAVPERLRYDVVSLHEDPGQPGGLGLSEV